MALPVHPEIKWIRFDTEYFAVDHSSPIHQRFLQKYGRYNTGRYADRYSHVLTDQEILMALTGGGRQRLIPQQIVQSLQAAYTLFDRSLFRVSARYWQQHSLAVAQRRWAALSKDPPELGRSTQWTADEWAKRILPLEEEGPADPRVVRAYVKAFFDISEERINTYRNPARPWNRLDTSHFGMVQRSTTPPNPATRRHSTTLRTIEIHPQTPAEQQHLSPAALQLPQRIHALTVNSFVSLEADRILPVIFERADYKTLIDKITARLAKHHSVNAPPNMIKMAFLRLPFDEFGFFNETDLHQEIASVEERAEAAEEEAQEAAEGGAANLEALKTRAWRLRTAAKNLRRDVGEFAPDGMETFQIRQVSKTDALAWGRQGFGPWQVIPELAVSAAKNEKVMRRWDDILREVGLNRQDLATVDSVREALTAPPASDPKKQLVIKALTYDLVMTTLDETWFVPGNGIDASIGSRGSLVDPELSRAIFYLTAAMWLIQFPDYVSFFKQHALREENAQDTSANDTETRYWILELEIDRLLNVGLRLGIDTTLPGLRPIDITPRSAREMGLWGSQRCLLRGGLHVIDFMHLQAGPQGEHASAISEQAFCFGPTVNYLDTTTPADVIRGYPKRTIPLAKEPDPEPTADNDEACGVAHDETEDE